MKSSQPTIENQDANPDTPKAALKAIAASTGSTLRSLLVLAPQNDPFNAGSETDVRAAQWFADIFRRYEFPSGTHVRRIHYFLVTLKEDVIRHDGKLYQNTDQCWNYIGNAAKKARHLGLVDPGDFVDRRNPEPSEYAADPRLAPEPRWEVDTDELYFSLPTIRTDLPVYLDLPEISVSGYDYDPGDQTYQLELWIEKSGENAILLPLCEEYGVNFRPGLGFQSITTAVRALNRCIEVAELGRPTRIFYISDFDPAGDCMPVAIARQFQFWLWKSGHNADVKLTPLALTKEQVQAYQLPRKPIKESDLRKANFEDRHGEGAVELDALEAIHPGELAIIVEEAFEQYRDLDLRDELDEADREADGEATAAWDDATADIREEIEALKSDAEVVAEEFRPRLEELDEEFQAAMAPFQKRMEELEERAREVIAEATYGLVVMLPPRPEPEIPPVDESAWLYDSTRGYGDQLEHFRIHQTGGAA